MRNKNPLQIKYLTTDAQHDSYPVAVSFYYHLLLAHYFQVDPNYLLCIPASIQESLQVRVVYKNVERNVCSLQSISKTPSTGLTPVMAHHKDTVSSRKLGKQLPPKVMQLVK